MPLLISRASPMGRVIEMVAWTPTQQPLSRMSTYRHLFLIGTICFVILLRTGLAIGQDWSTDSIYHTDELGILFCESEQLPENAIVSSSEACDTAMSSSPVSNQRSLHLLPDGLLWRSYLAGPHEPRISTVVFRDQKDDVFWDATLGGRVGLLRYGTAGAVKPQGWQWDLEGAVMTRLDILHAEDVESMDYRFGTELTAAEGPWAIKLGYFHISSHVGDEYLIRNPTFQRVNYVTESLIVGGSFQSSATFRFYGEIADAFRASGGAARYQFQTGLEYTPVARSLLVGAPFAAANFNFREAMDYDVATTIQLGWSFQSLESGRRIRFGIQYGDGPTSQYEFLGRSEEYLGGGVWFDY
ncbi:DUF1207 domain-containing protein [Aporhodopirellula aestuarii]|uniref:DUF1207 domain-containing protein n=1 Tax=Aporhodopirellula aestuarii TaxID=2950107 RepID=A0ABT0U6M5_9BACT|nr:DUF1207 domain-containing protein [Aporhodopirellula aestuarii]MCM2372575.1 DUF1207 domain-containing protein [Aporhodopirellula aestuarii]